MHTYMLYNFILICNLLLCNDVLILHMLCSGICALYERKLKELNPAMRNITYDIEDLYNFIDGLTDLSALVYVFLSHS